MAHWPTALTLHATTVAVDGRAAVIRGASGAGKSALALQLMAMGGALVSDDRTLVWRDGARLLADAPPTIRGEIEARGVGILSVPAAGPQPVKLLVDLGGAPAPRLPEAQSETLLDVELPVMKGSTAAHFPAALFFYLLHGRAA